MESNPIWANLAIIDSSQKTGFAVETLFVTDEETALTGAWFFEDSNDLDLLTVIESRIVILLDTGFPIDLSEVGSFPIQINDFLQDARDRASESVEIFNQYVANNILEYNAYMAIPPAERKLLPKVIKKKLEPIYMNNWDFELNLSFSGDELEKFGKRSEIKGTPPEMKLVNQSSWLVKHLLDLWKQDETERFSRAYMDDSFGEFKILPNSWLEVLKSQQKRVTANG